MIPQKQPLDSLKTLSLAGGNIDAWIYRRMLAGETPKVG
jgi:hypothetical protein